MIITKIYYLKMMNNKKLLVWIKNGCYTNDIINIIKYDAMDQIIILQKEICLLKNLKYFYCSMAEINEIPENFD